MKNKTVRTQIILVLMTMILTYPELNYAGWGDWFSRGQTEKDQKSINTLVLPDHMIYGDRPDLTDHTNEITDHGSIYIGLHGLDSVDRYFQNGPTILDNSVDGYGVKAVNSFVYALERARLHSPSEGGIVVEYKIKQEMHPRVIEWSDLVNNEVGIRLVKKYKTRNAVMKALKEQFNIPIIIESGKIYVMDLSVVDRPMTLAEATQQMYKKIADETNPRVLRDLQYNGAKRLYDVLASHVIASQSEGESCARILQFTNRSDEE